MFLAGGVNEDAADAAPLSGRGLSALTVLIPVGAQTARNSAQETTRGKTKMRIGMKYRRDQPLRGAPGFTIFLAHFGPRVFSFSNLSNDLRIKFNDRSMMQRLAPEPPGSGNKMILPISIPNFKKNTSSGSR